MKNSVSGHLSSAARPRAIRILSNKNLNHAEAAAIVAGGGERGVGGVAADMDEVIAAYAVMFLETPIELTLNLRREAASGPSCRPSSRSRAT